MGNRDFIFSDTEQHALKNLGISAVVLFGSRAIGTAREGSDYDIGVLLSSPKILHLPGKKNEIYDSLYDILSSKIQSLVNMDIVFLEQAPGELRAHVMKHGKPIFEASPNAFANFRERVMTEYADFASLREIFHQGILARIA
jgi:predicted nucleotidyltransferase